MAQRKTRDERKIPVTIYFTPDELDRIDRASRYSRGVVVRHCVNTILKREEIVRIAQERQVDPEFCTVEYATTTDFEIILDAYSDELIEPLKAAALNGHDVDGLVPTFMGLIERKLNKSTSERQVWRFLYEKMEELGITN